jgi:hypothetical protein
VRGDAVAVSPRRKRKNTTAGQRAIAVAEAWAMAIAEGKATEKRGGNMSKQNLKEGFVQGEASKHFGRMFGARHMQFAMARALLRSDTDALFGLCYR